MSLHSNAASTTYLHEEWKLNNFNFPCLHRIVGVSAMFKINSESVVALNNMHRIPVIPKQKRLRWRRHVRRMENRYIAKAVLYEK